jgi:hypothetical protein
MKFFVILLFISCLQYQNLQAQKPENAWNTLAKVKTVQQKHKTGSYEVAVPVFAPELLLLNGKTIVLQGYMIPLQELRKQNYFVLSRYPFSLCYFCGAAGVETVIEVSSQEQIRFTEDKITMKGVLKLNTNNPDQLLYVLEKAEFVR